MATQGIKERVALVLYLRYLLIPSFISIICCHTDRGGDGKATSVRVRDGKMVRMADPRLVGHAQVCAVKPTGCAIGAAQFLELHCQVRPQPSVSMRREGQLLLRSSLEPYRRTQKVLSSTKSTADWQLERQERRKLSRVRNSARR